ncbi:hypothetical protein QR680_017030 [Steinernema hermaphroditum]|uniref:Uncharacterized protein n=1 Tax=Steinernema hermaphroditum TaxID=289476 RepID=A0AA39HF88_9BILA|nr:hypothetical protein QR680_017030 [Steinernema hermaphroditum]
MSLNSVSTFLECHRNDTSCSAECNVPRTCYQVTECNDMKGSFHVCSDSDPNILWMLSTLLVILIACISILCCAACIYGSIIGISKYFRERGVEPYSSTDPKVSVSTSYTLNPNPSVKHFDSTYNSRKTTV